MIIRMMEKLLPGNRELVLEMTAIIALYGVVAAILETVLAKRVAYSLAGLAIGCVLAVYMLFYMNVILDRSMGNVGDQKAVERFVTKHSVIRYLSVALVFVVLCLTRIADPLACFIGLFGLKFAAFAQPLFHGMRKKD